ncbi:hypothetical protein HYX18_02510 [Candidatus Woesearchaeota archaeon]|nr:hypothetical protein [Candidatus Woesearchaeota archaeon]
MEREDDVLRQIAHNNIALQRSSLHLIEKISDLTKRIDKLVSLFEEASKHIEDVEEQEDKIKSLTEKLELLLEQNKEIAHGLLLLDKYIRGKSEFENINPKPLRSL